MRYSVNLAQMLLVLGVPCSVRDHAVDSATEGCLRSMMPLLCMLLQSRSVIRKSAVLCAPNKYHQAPHLTISL